MAWLVDTVADFVRAMLVLTGILGVMLCLETFFPKDRPGLESRVRGLVFLVVLTACSAVIANAFHAGWTRLGIEPLFRLARPHGWDGYYLAFSLFGWALADFGFYVRHRLQHAFFWRFHAVHHSIEQLSSASDYNHWTEDLFRIVLTVAPLSLLFGSTSTVLATTLFALHANYLHSSTRLHFGWFRRVFGDNRYHRIHHSKEPQHFNKNFAACFPIWDFLFGTAYVPRDDEWPATGIEGQPEPVTLKDYALRPFL